MHSRRHSNKSLMCWFLLFPVYINILVFPPSRWQYVCHYWALISVHEYTGQAFPSTNTSISNPQPLRVKRRVFPIVFGIYIGPMSWLIGTDTAHFSPRMKCRSFLSVYMQQSYIFSVFYMIVYKHNWLRSAFIIA